MSDAYIKRNAKMVAEACEAIEQHYFGKRSEETNAGRGRPCNEAKTRASGEETHS